MALIIDYRLVGTGWSTCVVQDGPAKCELSAPYLSDALGNLVLAAIAAVSGFMHLSFRFDLEPGEFRWVIRHVPPNEIEVEVLEFKGPEVGRPDSDGGSLFKTRCLPIEFAQAVHAAAQNVLDEFGEAGYAEKWAEHPFPTRQLAVLERQIVLRERGG